MLNAFSDLEFTTLDVVTVGDFDGVGAWVEQDGGGGACVGASSPIDFEDGLFWVVAVQGDVESGHSSSQVCRSILCLLLCFTVYVRPGGIDLHGCNAFISVERFDEATEVFEAQGCADAEGGGWNQVVCRFELAQCCCVLAAVEQA